jgi:hypothetical protein
MNTTRKEAKKRLARSQRPAALSNSACSLETETEMCHDSLSTMRIVICLEGCKWFGVHRFPLHVRKPRAAAFNKALVAVTTNSCPAHLLQPSVAAVWSSVCQRVGYGWNQCRHHNDSGKCRVDASCGINVVPAGGRRGGW